MKNWELLFFQGLSSLCDMYIVGLSAAGGLSQKNLCCTGKLGDLTWPIIKDLVDGVVTVSEEEILNATQLCYENLKVRFWANET